MQKHINNVVDNTDLTKVKKFLLQRGIYAADKIDEVESEYRKFLKLTAMYPEKKLPMVKSIDDFWHFHLLCSKDYRLMETQLKVKINHLPGDIDDEAEQNELQRALEEDFLPIYAKHFGEVPTCWNPKLAVCSCGSNCIADVEAA